MKIVKNIQRRRKKQSSHIVLDPPISTLKNNPKTNSFKNVTNRIKKQGKFKHINSFLKPPLKLLAKFCKWSHSKKCKTILK